MVLPVIPGQDEVPRFNEAPDYILTVNDHGNTTLYEVTLHEVWSQV